MSNGPIKVPPPTTPRPRADVPPPKLAAHGEHTHPCPWCFAAGAQQERERTDAARADADRLAAAARFDPYPGQEHPWHGGETLRGIARFLDRWDDERGSDNREAQADIRRWADAVDAALAAHDATLADR